MSKPLFIPLRGEEFDRFVRGEKRVEYRRVGRMFNLRQCTPCRLVILSRGYSGARLAGLIKEATVAPSRKGAGLDTYGPGAEIIAIEIDAIEPLPFTSRRKSAA